MGGHAYGRKLLITRSSTNVERSRHFTSAATCGGVPSCTKVEIRVLLLHYGAWQFIEESKTEPAETSEDSKPRVPGTSETSKVASAKQVLSWREEYNLKLRKDRSYTLIYQSLSPEFKPLISQTTDGAEAWRILKKHFEPTTRARISDDSKLPAEYQSIVHTIYQWTDAEFQPDKIESELLLEENRLRLTRKDLEIVSSIAFSNEMHRKEAAIDLCAMDCVDLIKWENVTQPPPTERFSDDMIAEAILNPAIIQEAILPTIKVFSCHPQATERIVKVVTEAAAAVF
ncbi:hypothetical protein AVEN_73752-1 [Araneus ventricosus]|uniref:Uncharacterized protein n=1 Tax=Araneus ventricosus TaxID=182803 RepID=A0A4Y2RF41_ARAVE|nr:hypothetical protein AVEN_73752-1 [Araneus ventricosus]